MDNVNNVKYSALNVILHLVIVHSATKYLKIDILITINNKVDANARKDIILYINKHANNVNTYVFKIVLNVIMIGVNTIANNVLKTIL